MYPCKDLQISKHFNLFQSKHTADIKTSVLYVSGKPAIVTLDYVIDMASAIDEDDKIATENTIR